MSILTGLGDFVERLFNETLPLLDEREESSWNKDRLYIERFIRGGLSGSMSSFESSERLSELAFVRRGGLESEPLRLGTPSLVWSGGDDSEGVERYGRAERATMSPFSLTVHFWPISDALRGSRGDSKLCSAMGDARARLFLDPVDWML